MGWNPTPGHSAEKSSLFHEDIFQDLNIWHSVWSDCPQFAESFGHGTCWFFSVVFPEFFFEDIIVFLFNYANMTISVNGVLNTKLAQYTEQAFKLTTGFGLLMQS